MADDVKGRKLQAARDILDILLEISTILVRHPPTSSLCFSRPYIDPSSNSCSFIFTPCSVRLPTFVRPRKQKAASLVDRATEYKSRPQDIVNLRLFD